MLPTEVRVTATTHPLFGRVVPASGFKRRSGVLLLVVTLPDGTPGTIRADATDILSESSGEPDSTVLSVEGFRQLRVLVTALALAPKRRNRPKTRK